SPRTLLPRLRPHLCRRPAPDLVLGRLPPARLPAPPPASRPGPGPPPAPPLQDRRRLPMPGVRDPPPRQPTLPRLRHLLPPPARPRRPLPTLRRARRPLRSHHRPDRRPMTTSASLRSDNARRCRSDFAAPPPPAPARPAAPPRLSLVSEETGGQPA